MTLDLNFQIRKDAKRALKGNFSKAIAVLIAVISVSLLLNYAFSMFGFLADRNGFIPPMPDPYDYTWDEIPYFLQELSLIPLWIPLAAGGFFLVSFLILAPLRMGAVRWYYEVASAHPVTVGDLFFYFSSFGKYCRVIWYRIILFFRMLFWGILFFLLPGAVFAGAGYLYSIASEPIHYALTGVLTAAGGIFAFLMLLFYIVFSERYFLVPYLMAEHDNFSVWKCFSLSVRYSRGCRWSILGFKLSFAPWFVLCFLFLPILYVSPYFNTFLAILSKVIACSGERRRMEKASASPASASEEMYSEPAAPSPSVSPASSEPISPAASEPVSPAVSEPVSPASAADDRPKPSCLSYDDMPTAEINAAAEPLKEILRKEAEAASAPSDSEPVLSDSEPASQSPAEDLASVLNDVASIGSSAEKDGLSGK